MASPLLRKPRATQKEIARELGISQAAVAMALNAKTQCKLTPETVALVQSKAEEMNYTPQRQASILRSGRSHTIGAVMIGGIYYAPRERVHHLAQEAINAGYQLIALEVNWFGDNLKGMQDYLLGMAVEGVVFCNIYAEPATLWEAFLREKGLPGVSFSSTFQGLDVAEIDLCDTFAQLTSHHLEQGSRHLNLILPYHHPIDDPDQVGRHVSQRARGFAQALEAVGGEVVAAPDAAKLLHVGTRYSKGHSGPKGTIHYPHYSEIYGDAFDIGYLTAKEILSSQSILADSLVCSNDDIAVGALRACYELGVKVPAEVRISGSDNAPFTRHSIVPITTVSQSSRDMAKWCIKRLIELIENPEARSQRQEKQFPSELICRQSTLSSTSV